MFRGRYKHVCEEAWPPLAALEFTPGVNDDHDYLGADRFVMKVCVMRQNTRNEPFRRHGLSDVHD